jgi:hypothetical protein
MVIVVRSLGMVISKRRGRKPLHGKSKAVTSDRIPKGMSESGGASESFAYTKNYQIGSSGAWQLTSSNSGSGGASGSGWTYSSYSGSTPYTGTLQPFAASATGLTAILVNGSDQQSGSNNTSYSFQTVAVFNGIDWSETGNKTSSGSGGTSDAISASASGFTFTSPSIGVTTTSGSAGLSGTTTTSYSYTQQAFLDDNGTWQNGASTGPAGSGSMSAAGTLKEEKVTATKIDKTGQYG